MPKKNRQIVERFTYGDHTYKPGDEEKLADSGIAQWNLNDLATKGWIAGDWTNAGLTPEEEAKAAAEAAEPAAGKPKK